jgi:hypothetical protein
VKDFFFYYFPRALGFVWVRVQAATEMGCNQHETIVRRMRLIICKSAGGICDVFCVGCGENGVGGLAA